MTDPVQTLQAVLDENASLKETNRSLHRRVQAMESGVFKEDLVRGAEFQRLMADLYAKDYHKQYRQVASLEASLTVCYDAAARVLELPRMRDIHRRWSGEIERPRFHVHVIADSQSRKVICVIDAEKAILHAFKVYRLRNENEAGGGPARAQRIVDAYRNAIASWTLDGPTVTDTVQQLIIGDRNAG